MPSRTPHVKTRHGCHTCKRRRVRCDLGRPVCANCQRLEQQCSWPELFHIETVLANEREQRCPEASRDEEMSMPAQLDSNQFMENMRLLHHYTVYTSSTLSDKADVQRVWRVQVADHAFRHTFLLDSVLALAALDYARRPKTSNRHHWMDIAQSHFSRGLSRYLELLRNVDQETCGALYTAAYLNGISSYGFLVSIDAAAHPAAFIDKLIETFELLRASSVIVAEAGDWLYRSDLALLLRPTRATQQPASTARQVWTPRHELASLMAHVQTSYVIHSGDIASPDDNIPNVNQLYLSSIERLVPVLPTNDTEAPLLSSVMMWPAAVESGYIELLKRRDPTAMILLNHYGTILHRISDAWFLDGVGSKMHGAIAVTIDQEWRPYLNMSSWSVAKTTGFARSSLLQGDIATGWSNADSI